MPGNPVAFDYAAAPRFQSPRLQRPIQCGRAAHGKIAAPPNPGSSAAPNEMYAIPNRRTVQDVVSLPLVWETPLRTGNLRDPNGPQSTFASESFIDEMAVAAKADPVEFRMRLLTASTTDDNAFKRARSIAVIKAAAQAYGWDTRPSPRPIGGETFSPAAVSPTPQLMQVAEIAEVEVNRKTGHVWVKRLVCAHDCDWPSIRKDCGEPSRAA